MTALIFALAALLSSTAPAEEPRFRNVVVIAVDGLRADHLGLYGYPVATSPGLDARSAGAVVFDRAISQASWTLPSFTTLFTSRDPLDHGINNSHLTVPPQADILAVVLKAAGFSTAGFVGGHFLDTFYGLAQGFDVFRGDGQAMFRFFPETAAQGADWIRSWSGGRHFLFIQGNDVHPPFDLVRQPATMRHVFDGDYRGEVDKLLIDYTFVEVFNHIDAAGAPPPPEYLAAVERIRANPADMRHIAAHYDAQIRETDEALRQVFTALEKTGRAKDTVVVLMADHGLELGEKDRMATGFHLTQYQSVIRVPLIMWIPGVAPRRVSEPVELMDVAPTLLELVGVTAPPSYQGRSLVPLARGGREKDRLAFSSSSLVVDKASEPRLFSVQDARFKLIYDPLTRRRVLYDLHADPSETADVSTNSPADLTRLTQDLARHLRRPVP